jgi:hypothetical protein
MTVRTHELAFFDFGEDPSSASAVNHRSNILELDPTGEMIEVHRGMMEETAAVGTGLIPLQRSEPFDFLARSLLLL